MQNTNNQNLKDELKKNLQDEIKKEIKEELKEELQENKKTKKNFLKKIFNFGLDMTFTSRYLNRWAEKKSKDIKNPFLKNIVEGLTYKKTYNFDSLGNFFNNLDNKNFINKEKSPYISSIWQELKGESMEEKISKEIKQNKINLEKNSQNSENTQNKVNLEKNSQNTQNTQNKINLEKNSQNSKNTENTENKINLEKNTENTENKTNSEKNSKKTSKNIEDLIEPEVLEDAQLRYIEMMNFYQHTETDRTRAIKNFQLEIKLCKYAIYISFVLFIISVFFWGSMSVVMSLVAMAFAWVKGSITAFYLWQTQKRACLSFALFIKDDGWFKIFE